MCLQVDFDFCALITVLDGLVYTLTQQAEQAGLKLPSKDVPCVFPDDTNLSAWVKVPSSQLKQHMKDKQFLVSCWLSYRVRVRESQQKRHIERQTFCGELPSDRLERSRLA